MPRLRFTRPTNPQGSAGGPIADEPRIADESRIAAAPPPQIVNTAAAATREERDLIEQVQTRLLSEPEPLGARQEPEYFLRRIAAIVADLLEQTGRVKSDRERSRLTPLAQ
jgi:hypothetical protein